MVAGCAANYMPLVAAWLPVVTIIIIPSEFREPATSGIIYV